MNRIIVVMVAAAVALAAAPARGDGRGKAEAYFNAGDQAFREQNFAAAAEEFELAYRELALPEIAFSAAQAYRRQYFVDPKPEYVKRAVELYRVYLDHVKTGGRVGDASDGLAEMNRELDRLVAGGAKIGEVARTNTRIAVSVSVIGDEQAALSEVAVMPASTATKATATLDGKPMELFAPIAVDPGDHTVAVTAPGYMPVAETRRVVEGATELVAVQLVPKLARITIAAPEGARVAINGHAAGNAPVPVQELAAGTYVITATARGREAAEQDVTVGRDEQKTVTLVMVPTRRRRVVPWLAIGAGVLAAGAIVSTVYAVHYDNEMSFIDHERTTEGISLATLADYHRVTDDRNTDRALAFSLGGAAVAAGVVAAALYYFDVPLPGEHAVVPTVTAGGGGMALVGHF